MDGGRMRHLSSVHNSRRLWCQRVALHKRVEDHKARAQCAVAASRKRGQPAIEHHYCAGTPYTPTSLRQLKRSANIEPNRERLLVAVEQVIELAPVPIR